MLQNFSGELHSVYSSLSECFPVFICYLYFSVLCDIILNCSVAHTERPTIAHGMQWSRSRLCTAPMTASILSTLQAVAAALLAAAAVAAVANYPVPLAGLIQPLLALLFQLSRLRRCLIIGGWCVSSDQFLKNRNHVSASSVCYTGFCNHIALRSLSQTKN